MLLKNAARWMAILVLSAGAGRVCGDVGDTSGADGIGPLATNASAIGGEKFSVDPRSGVLDYRFTFFQGNVNYAQTPFSLALNYQQTASGSYVGDFSSDTHPHPYGVSAYLPVPAPKATNGGNYDDAGAIWDLNLPALFIGTGRTSKFYGDKQISASLSLNDATYTYLLTFPSLSDTTDPSVFVPPYTAAIINAGAAGALYNINSKYLKFSPGSDNQSFVVQDKEGVNYTFRFAVLYGYKGVGNYQPGYQAGSGSDPTADEVLVYRIQSIVYPSGQALNFSYQDDFVNNTSHTVTVKDTANSSANTIATLSFSGQTGSVKIANQQGTLASVYAIGLDNLYRLSTLTNLVSNRSWSYTHETLQAMPYSWVNQTALTRIANNYTGLATNIAYVQFNSNSVYDAGCNSMSIAESAVSSVYNYHGGVEVSHSSYDYGFGVAGKPNFVIPHASGKKTYGSGLSHWLDNIFVTGNKDSNRCGSGDNLDMYAQSYSTNIATVYAGDANNPRNAVQTVSYDALGRMTENKIVRATGSSLVSDITYAYAVAASDVGTANAQYPAFANLPVSYASPTRKSTTVNTCWLNGTASAYQPSCYVYYQQSWAYDNDGNITQSISPTNQETDVSYLAASSTNPAYARLPAVTTTWSIGGNSQAGGSKIIQTQNYANLQIAPSGSGAISTTTLPTTSSETHYDMGAPQNGTYTYRTESLGYVGNSATRALNGLLNLRQQADGTGASDISAMQTQFNPTLVSSGGQAVLNVGSVLSGQAGSASKALNIGNSQLNFMGYTLQSANTLNQVAAQTYDNLARIVSDTKMQGTPYAQTTQYVYDADLPMCVSPCVGAKFSIRKTDYLGNKDIRFYDYRFRPVASYLQLAGAASPALVERFVIDDYTSLVTSASRYGNNYSKTIRYYYMPGTDEIAAAVPNVGLAHGRILDSVNGNNFTFSYVPASNAPTTIQRIIGGVAVSHVDIISGITLYDGVVSAEAATSALQGWDFVNIAASQPLSSQSSLNLWLAAGKLVHPALNALYQAIGQHAASALTPMDNLLSLTNYRYDEWNRQVGADNYTFPNSAGGPPALQLKTTLLSYDNAHRRHTVTYPQGQQQTSVFNLLNGLQASSLTVGGTTTALGSFQHDGLGRVVQYNDALNGPASKTTWGYDNSTGLLTGGTDAYGNVLSVLYNSIMYKPVQLNISPAASGAAVVVSKAYDKYGRATTVSDSLGNWYSRTYLSNGLLGSYSLRRNGQPTVYRSNYSYDAYGDLVSLSDPFLPIGGQGTPPNCPLDQTNANSPYGYAISRDAYGRLSQISAQQFYGLGLSLGYDAATGAVSNVNLQNLPLAYVTGCGLDKTLNLATSYVYDPYLRPTSQTTQAAVSGVVFGSAQFSQSFDLAGQVVSATRLDMAGKSLVEAFGYDPVTGALTSYRNDGGGAAPHGYASIDGPLGGESYRYDVYGNLTQWQARNTGAATVMTRTYNYDANNPFRLNSISETRPGGSFSGQYVYDVAGNATADAFGRRFSYNAQGLLGAIQLPNGSRQTLAYDGLGQLTQKQFSGDSPVWLYGSAQVKAGKWQAHYLGGHLYYAPAGGGSSVLESGAVVDVADLGGRAINSIAYAAGNETVSLIGNNSYTPFGVMTDLIGGNASAGYPANLSNATDYPASAWGAVHGREVGSGLHLLGGQRAYDPVLGRFLQMDSMSPFGRGGLNGYEYALDNPIAYGDPSGHYATLKHKRYGPKPPSADHSSGGCSGGGGFFGGFVSGVCSALKTAAMSVYDTVVNEGKSVQDLMSGNYEGYLKRQENQAVQTYNQTVNTVKYTLNNPGGPIATLMFQEMNLKPTNLAQGKSPYHKYHVSSYEAGYTLGEAGTADAIELLAMLGGEALVGSLEEAALEQESIDDGVMADAESAGGDTHPSADNGNVDNDNAIGHAADEHGADNGNGNGAEDHGSAKEGGEPGGEGSAQTGHGEAAEDPAAHAVGHRSALADTYKLLGKVVEALDHAHTFTSQIQERSAAYEESQKTEKKDGSSVRAGFGQIGLDSNYTGVRIDRFDVRPDLTGAAWLGAEPSGNSLWPAPAKAGSDNP